MMKEYKEGLITQKATGHADGAAMVYKVVHDIIALHKERGNTTDEIVQAVDSFCVKSLNMDRDTVINLYKKIY